MFDITISRSLLEPLLTRAAVIAKEKSPLVALRCVLLDAQRNSLQALSTDTFLGIEELVAAEVRGEGRIAVDAQRFASFVKELKHDEISLKYDGTSLHVKCDKGRFKMPVLRHEDFPGLPSADDAPEFAKLDARDLARGLAQGTYAMRDMASLPQLNATLLETSSADGVGEMRLVSTDSQRLTVSSVPATCGTSKMLLPAKAVSELKKLADANKGGGFDVRCDGGTAFFSAGGVTLSAKLLDMPYPPYRKLFPASPEATTTLHRDTLTDAIRRVALLSEETDGGSVNLTFAEGSLRIHGASADAGEGEDFVECDANFDMTLRINPKALCDALNHLPDDEVRLELSGPKGPVIVNGATSTEVRGLVMTRSTVAP